MAVRAALGAAPRRLCDGGDLAESCRRVDVPTLIVDGTADIRPRDAVDSLAAALPSVRRVALEAAGHLPWVERPSAADHGAALGHPFVDDHPGWRRAA